MDLTHGDPHPSTGDELKRHIVRMEDALDHVRIELDRKTPVRAMIEGGEWLCKG